MKALAGEWEAQNARARVSYQVIAGGPAVLEQGAMAAGEEKATACYLDGGRLLLADYGVAKNQPRMLAN